ncbi:ATP-dependent DNA helicase srs2 [Recurvomyces mirabilis]|nr:ATP-dependent DNA helicase srs2 [Recurvomyces mirabilis]
MASDILKGLNRAQREAVTSEANVVQVLAPPGSGKTKTLTARVAYLLAHRQLQPWNIIVCTFTVRAASEMKERIRGFVGDECAKQLKLGTFHSIALRYLKQYGTHIGLQKDFGVADTADSRAIVKRIVKQNDLSMDANQARSKISSQKAKGIDAEEFARTRKNAEQQEFSQIYEEYQAMLEASNLLDYDDLLLRCCVLLRTKRECVKNVQALLIDEFQDTNNIQYDLMSLFAQERNAITIVGDPDQSIYGFRSAEIKNLSRMKEGWPDTLTINLEENYRSSGAILHAAQHIIEQDESRPPKRLQATHTFGLRPVLRKLPHAQAEAEWLVSEIKRLQALTGNMLQGSDFAVLLRSAALSRVIETALGQAGVPYRMVGGARFYDRVEIKLLLDYLRVIDTPGNGEALERIINVPARRIGEATVKALAEEARIKERTLWNHVEAVAQGRCRSKVKINEPAMLGLRKFVGIVLGGRKKIKAAADGPVPVVDILNLVIKKLSFEKYLSEHYKEDHETRWSYVEELLAQATEASDPARLQSLIEESTLPDISGLEQVAISAKDDALSLFLANIALTASSAGKAEEDGEQVQQLTISTIHAAKGLEWPVVFIPACYDGSIPHSRAEDHDEERRLLYVGMTRAQAVLYLSSPQRNSQREEAVLSTFIAQSGVSSFFEEHGPSIAMTEVTGLATTLRRERPAPATLAECKKGLDTDEDDYWPLTGELPLAELAKWDYGNAGGQATRPAAVYSSASITMQQQSDFPGAIAAAAPGFTSLKTKYEEAKEELTLAQMDRRAQQAKKLETEKPKGRKRQMEGQGTIASFFGKPTLSKQISETTSLGSSAAAKGPGMPAEPKRKRQAHQELDNVKAVRSEVVVERQNMLDHKVRTAPLLRQKSATSAQHSVPAAGYMFLSSSPPRPEDAEISTSATIPPFEEEDTENYAQARPATTLHTTSMQRVAPQKKTLGMRRSLHGWSARGGKG